ncbi:hypothetical protein K0M31_011926 [Melipona bicolor]|uniref:Uncharacterized protein n=1 Tax=Melipona bicolor TaxID=60889 RepID=A0AA40GAH7_9HYME|nr:hypothetical protein K0M31_011926 [Melipona bicolor]
MSHAFTKSYVGRSGHNGRQLVTIHTRNSMPSEMPSKRGVQRAELYTMENPDGDPAKSLVSLGSRIACDRARLPFLRAISGVTSDDIPRQIRSPRDDELIRIAPSNQASNSDKFFQFLDRFIL